MLNDDEDIETMSVERLRALRDEVLSLIEQIGTRDVSVDPHAHEEIEELDELLEAVEERIAEIEPKAS